MATIVTIKRKGLFKKEVNYKDILFDDLEFGTMDEAYRLVPQKIGDYTIIYDPKNICRGFELSIKKNEVELRLPLPNSEHDTRLFYDYVKRVCKVMDTDVFKREGEKVSLNEIDKFIEMELNCSQNVIKEFEEKTKETDGNKLHIFGVMNPITIGKKEIEIFDNNLEKFSKYLNELQQIDAYYAKPKIYQKTDGSLFGIYVLTEDVVSIFPINPKNIFMNTNDIEDWSIGFVIDNTLAGTISYKDFTNNVDRSNIYDTDHFIIKATRKELNDLLEKYKRDL